MQPASASKTTQDTLIRRFLLWFFGWPATAYFTFNISVDFTTARSYLKQLNASGGPKVTVNHLVAAVIGRTLSEHPAANGRIIGRQIVQPDQVGVAMPVNLLGHHGGKQQELSMAIVSHIDSRPLREIAAETTRTVSAERQGKPQNAAVRRMIAMGEAMPSVVMHHALEGMARAMRHRRVADSVYKMMPATTGLTNPGSAFTQLEGAIFRGGAFTMPSRGFHLGTVWGLSTVQDEVIAVKGSPVVRPMLPVAVLIDHRLVDGVRAARMVVRFTEIMQNPQALLGPDGNQIGAGVQK